jgi:hypothetical protein
MSYVSLKIVVDSSKSAAPGSLRGWKIYNAPSETVGSSGPDWHRSVVGVGLLVVVRSLDIDSAVVSSDVTVVRGGVSVASSPVSEQPARAAARAGPPALRRARRESGVSILDTVSLAL